jgi:peptide/nickel transport system permease protein
MATVTHSRRRTLLYNLKRLANFLGIFVKNPRGILGIVIIAVFSFIAFFPAALTPYDPAFDLKLSGYFAAPSWLVSFPTDLGGMPDLSSNINPLTNPNFASDLTGWNWTSSDPAHASVEYRENVDDHSGVAYLHFERDEIGVSYGNVTLAMYYDFYFPYKGPPFSLDGGIICLFNGSVTISVVNESLPALGGEWPPPVISVIKRTLDVPMNIEAYIEALSINQTLKLWPLRQYSIYHLKGLENLTRDDTLQDVSGKWVDSAAAQTPISTDSDLVSKMITSRFGSALRPVQRFFPLEACPGYYRVGFRITFIDNDASKPVDAEAYLDTINFEVFGTSWGIMGTDHLGRDLWSQLIYGTKISLYVGVLSSLMAVSIGLVVGLMAGYLGKIVDEFLMRVCDVLLVLPGLPLLIVLVAVLGTSIDNLIILLGALGWMGFARLVRSQVISLKERPFVESAKAIGASKTHIMFRHILPNVMSLVYVTLATTVPGNIVAEASLGFLGFSDPNRISWGLMLNEMAANAAYRNWWWVIPPGLCIAAIAIAFILFGYALDEILNPKLRLRK